MTKRVLVLTDDELLLLVSWSEVARSASLEAPLPDGVVAHDWEDSDDELLAKVEEARLR